MYFCPKVVNKNLKMTHLKMKKKETGEQKM